VFMLINYYIYMQISTRIYGTRERVSNNIFTTGRVGGVYAEHNLLFYTQKYSGLISNVHETSIYY